MKNATFWDVMLCSLVEDICFAVNLLLAGHLLGLHFDSDNGGSMFLSNTGKLLLDYIVLHPRRQYS
jgi:hypothetical protein